MVCIRKTLLDFCRVGGCRKRVCPRGQNLYTIQEKGYICPAFQKSVPLVYFSDDTIRPIVLDFEQISLDLRTNSVHRRKILYYSTCS